jgi:hypothetical protein
MTIIETILGNTPRTTNQSIHKHSITLNFVLSDCNQNYVLPYREYVIASPVRKQRDPCLHASKHGT